MAATAYITKSEAQAALGCDGFWRLYQAGQLTVDHEAGGMQYFAKSLVDGYGRTDDGPPAGIVRKSMGSRAARENASRQIESISLRGSARPLAEHADDVDDDDDTDDDMDEEKSRRLYEEYFGDDDEEEEEPEPEPTPEQRLLNSYARNCRIIRRQAKAYLSEVRRNDWDAERVLAFASEAAQLRQLVEGLLRGRRKP